MYAKCESMHRAREVFESLEHPDVVCWNALILGYAENGEGQISLDLFSRMKHQCCESNASTFLAVIKACTSIAGKENDSKARGKRMHLLALRMGCDSDMYVQGSLLDMYSKCGSIEDVVGVFNRIKHPDVVCWNALILGHAENGEPVSALAFLSQMRHQGRLPNARTFVAALKACTYFSMPNEGYKVANVARVKKVQLLTLASGWYSNIYVKCTLIDIYANCGNMADARSVFDSINHPDEVCWNTLIMGYAENGEGEISLDLFSRMTCKPKEITFVAALKACIGLSLKKPGELVYRRASLVHLLAVRDGFDSNVYVINTLVDTYAKCGNMELACQAFHKLEQPNVVCWNCLIAGYADNGMGDVALDVFSQMRRGACIPNARTFVAVLKVCTFLVSIERGKKLHLLTYGYGCDSDIYVQSTLVDMYAKCGAMADARRIFDSMRKRDVVCWNALILGYADNGEGKMALDLYLQMALEGIAPNSFTISIVLKACAMIGALETGKLFHAQIENSCLKDDTVLTTCLLDFYSKCGSLDDAEHVFVSHARGDLVTWNVLMEGYSRQGNTDSVLSLFDKMKNTNLEPDEMTFNSILSACSHAGLIKKGKHYFEVMTLKYGINPSVEHYNCMIDMFARANMLDDAMLFLRDKPFNPNEVTWMVVLGACQKWRYMLLGRLAFDSLMYLNAILMQ